MARFLPLARFLPSGKEKGGKEKGPPLIYKPLNMSGGPFLPFNSNPVRQAVRALAVSCVFAMNDFVA